MQHFLARRHLFRGVALALSILVTFVLLEPSVQVLVRTGLLSTPRPPGSKTNYWAGDHETLGVWHHPLTTAVHRTDCFAVTYQTNSLGARDVEREKVAARPRVVVLGDSFVEGWGIPIEQRLTNLLEQSTGFEHLNFAMSHFGPYQYYLVYRELGKEYDADDVLVGIVPINDFFDLDYEMARNAPSYEYRYRPYLVGEYPDFRQINYREPRIQRFFRRHSYAYNALAQAYYQIKGHDGPGAGPPSQDASGLFHSYFYDFTDEQYNLLRYCLEMILAEAKGKRVAVFLIPAQRDFLRYHQSGESQLYRQLNEWASAHGLRVVDLLPHMYRYTSNWNEYYFPCDYHWNGLGNAVAASILEHELRGFFYELRQTGLPQPVHLLSSGQIP